MTSCESSQQPDYSAVVEAKVVNLTAEYAEVLILKRTYGSLPMPGATIVVNRHMASELQSAISVSELNEATSYKLYLKPGLRGGWAVIMAEPAVEAKPTK